MVTTAKKRARVFDRDSLKAASNGRKLAEVVAEAMEQQIVEAGWPIGRVLGSEPELLERFGVSRAVFREAMRIVENHRVAYMRRGPNGGLVVARPDIASLTRSAALLLDYENVTGPQLAEARMTVELAVVDRAAARIDEDGITQLKYAIEQEARNVDGTGHVEPGASDQILPGAHDLHVLIASLAGNPALELFVKVLIQLTSTEHGRKVFDTKAPSAQERSRMAREQHRAHKAIVDAIISGDGALAQHRMRRHLQAMEPWLS